MAARRWRSMKAAFGLDEMRLQIVHGVALPCPSTVQKEPNEVHGQPNEKKPDQPIMLAAGKRSGKKFVHGQAHHGQAKTGTGDGTANNPGTFPAGPETGDKYAEGDERPGRKKHDGKRLSHARDTKATNLIS